MIKSNASDTFHERVVSSWLDKNYDTFQSNSQKIQLEIILRHNMMLFCCQKNEYDQDLRENFREMDRLYSENAQTKAKCEQLEEENQGLEQGLKEVGKLLAYSKTILSLK